MPKFTALARRRCSASIISGGTPKTSRSRKRVNVVAASEGLDQQRIVGKVRQQAQLDLRIVGGKQHISRLGDERCTDLAPKLRSNGNVLQVRILRRSRPVAALV